MFTTLLIESVRYAWFHKKPSLHVSVSGVVEFTVTRQLLWDYGGPKRYTVCEACQAMEWRSRLNRRNLFQKHACAYPKALKGTVELCRRAGDPDWSSTLKNYDFTIGTTKDLPGLRGLLVWTGNSDLMVDPKADRGCIDFRQRLAPFQVDILNCNKVKLIEEYDFIFEQCHVHGPIYPRKKTGPKILLYCHDHHKHIPQRQKMLNAQPHAILTAYPTIWEKYYKVHRNTKVVFTPFVQGTFFARPSIAYSKRKLDVLAIGAAGGNIYPERAAIAQIIKGVGDRRWKAHTRSHHSIPFRAGNNVAGGGLLLERWSELLTTSKIVLFGPDRWGYLVRKYTEILASGSLMVCSRIPDLDRLGLKPNIHYVPLQRPLDQKLVPMLQNILLQWPKYEKIARAGLEWHKRNSDDWLFSKFEKEIVRLCRG